jgi:hypothetical protein
MSARSAETERRNVGSLHRRAAVRSLTPAAAEASRRVCPLATARASASSAFRLPPCATVCPPIAPESPSFYGPYRHPRKGRSGRIAPYQHRRYGKLQHTSDHLAVHQAQLSMSRGSPTRPSTDASRDLQPINPTQRSGLTPPWHSPANSVSGPHLRAPVLAERSRSAHR